MDDDEAALLAELRAISNKSAASRFDSNDGDDDDDDAATPPPPPPASTPAPAPAAKVESKNPDTFVEEVKEDPIAISEPAEKEEQAKTDDSDLPPEAILGGGGTFKQEVSSSGNTFQGERGGAAEDEDLLAELRAISAKSSSADRFVSSEDISATPDVVEENTTVPAATATTSETKKKPQPQRTELPPWKRGKAATSVQQQARNDIDIVVAAPPPPKEMSSAVQEEAEAATVKDEEEAMPSVSAEEKPPLQLSTEAIMGGGGNFQQFSTFQGERGGTAEDEELLAELRAISAKSSSTDRFANDDDGEVPAPSKSASVEPTKNATPASKQEDALPPWKRGKSNLRGVSKQPDVEVVVAAPPPLKPTAESAQEKSLAATEPQGSFQKDDTSKSTFQGERGGPAEDEELLAELRAISSGKASSSSRFNDDDDNVNIEVAPQEEKKASEESKPNPTVMDIPMGGNFQKSDLPQTFNGDRGGSAEDAELLAELRAISAGTGGASRFSDEAQAAPPPASKPKEDHKEHEREVSVPAPAAVDIPVGGNFQKSNLPQTFNGDRGGAAEDADLLAELRAISAGTGGSSRFSDDSAGNEIQLAKPEPPGTSTSSGLSASQPDPFPSTSAPPEEINVSEEELPSSITDNNWKIRKESYVVLRKLIVDADGGGEATGDLDANSVMSGLDGLIATVLMDKNANALESALLLAVAYADRCTGAQAAGKADEITKALLKGNGFSSPRPAASKITTELVLKLMEVGNGTESVHVVTGCLLDLGVSSKKPKVVALSMSILLEAARSFGAACLPLAAVNGALPKLLAHSNKQVRDTALELAAEFCRALKSRGPMEPVISNMKKTQVKELDQLLEKQPDATPARIGLRSQREGGKPQASPDDALAALQAGAKELEAQRYANRPAVNLIGAISKTDYQARLKHTKWSEKAAALDTILECGGEKPYKLVDQSNSVNYAPLISEMKGALSHTHFAVNGKAMQVLGMLAEGVGEKLYPFLRPLLSSLLSKGKDKKLTKFLGPCLDAFFGHILAFEHLLGADGCLPDALDERKEKNALARTLALEFFGRCIKRRDEAGPRGHMTSRAALACAEFASGKLDDSDAKVRKAALDCLKQLQQVDVPELVHAANDVIEGLKDKNPRAYKSLSAGLNSSAASGSARPAPSSPPKSAKKISPFQNVVESPAKTRSPGPTRYTSHEPVLAKPVPPRASTGTATVPASGDIPSLGNAVSRLASLELANWDAADEDGGILAGLESTKWLYRQNAIKAIASFVSDRQLLESSEDIHADTESICVFVREHTRGFKETNIQVNKSIIELFLALADYHEKCNQLLPEWVAKSAVTLATEKIADKKLSTIGKELLIGLCVVQTPKAIFESAIETISNIKAPTAHDELLKWGKLFCNEFGASSLSSALPSIVQWLVDETKSSNINVKKSAFAVFGIMHIHLGPQFQVLALSSTQDGSLRDQLEKTFDKHPFDPSSTTAEWPKQSLARSASNQTTDSDGKVSMMQLDLPKLDLISELSSDILLKMSSSDGKTAWKQRKAAMEEVETVLKKSSGMLDSSRLKPIVDLLRGLKERMSDSQSNLKPVAARIIGTILGSVDSIAQAKLGKVVYGGLINSAMNDNKKNMHDACIEAIRRSTSLCALEGEGPNGLAVEPFLSALVGELSVSELKANGISEVLNFTKEFQTFPNLESITAQRGECLAEKFSRVLIDCLTSPKSDIRSSAESLLMFCLDNDSIKIDTVRKAAGRLKPAKQRSVGPIIAKLSTSTATESTGERVKSLPSKGNSERSKPALSQPAPKQKFSMFQRRAATKKDTPKKSIGNESKPSAALHPLISDSGSAGFQKSKAAMRLITWPEYPEEPTGLPLLGSVKKAWAPLITNDTLKELFPEKGIRKMDDAMSGCKLISRAIAMERADEGRAVEEQFSLIIKWMVYVLCCKESTVGLQALLTLFAEVFDFLKEAQYQLSDSEAMVVVPFLFDRASSAKGRFKDTYIDLIAQVTSEDILPVKTLGSLVCVAIIESSNHAKARVMACRECCACVESIGLSGLGKKGVLVAAKALSEEKLPENRSAYLDLMELILPRMNGDMQRFVRICGPNLSNQARELIEERLKKGVPGDFPSNGARRVSNSGQAIPGDRRRSDSTRPDVLHGGQSRKSGIPSMPTEARNDSNEGERSFSDQLPAFDWNISNPPPGSHKGGLQSDPSSVPSKQISFSLNGRGSGTEDHDSRSKPTFGDSLTGIHFEGNSIPEYSGAVKDSTGESEPLGAAASLRARLMKIREKNQGQASEPKEPLSVETAEKTLDGLLSDNEEPDLTAETPRNLSDETSLATIKEILAKSFASFQKLSEKHTPLAENDVDIVDCTESLKTIHAAISQQPQLAVNLDANAVKELRSLISHRVNDLVGCLTNLVGFGFDCHEASSSGGISVPLLSVDLACLMALFRSDDLSKKVSEDVLTVLIREAGKALLDPRLASSSSSTLDEATSTQMVRAINKLAVQAATGSTRHVSLQALMTLQLQLGLEQDVGADTVFNSRLSRVVTKLFARVLKAEEGSPAAFSTTSMDMEVVLCSLEDTLGACDHAEEEGRSADGVAASRNIAKTLVSSIIKTRGGSSTLRSQMEELGIDPEASLLGKVVDQCTKEMGLKSSPPRTFTRDVQPDVASLVAAVGSAREGPERQGAVVELKKYKQEHGSEALDAHLNEVSGAFRDFIQQQMEESSSQHTENQLENSKATTMSERIKNLRSKLNATEVAVQSAVETSTTVPVSSYSSATSSGKSSPEKSTSVRAFRERLAAAQEKRTTSVIEPGIEETSTVQATTSTTSVSTNAPSNRAAALRARLEAVKRQTHIE